MRPYLVLTTVVLLAVAAFGQQPFPHPYGACFDGCGPYVPFLSTPEISLQQVSPNPVGASNATTGLIAGATNSTLSQLEGSTSSVYTVSVWYQGGAPLTTPQVHLWPEPVGHEGHVMHGPMFPMHEEHMREDHMHAEHMREAHATREETRGEWTYFTGRESTSVAKSFKKATHSYSNDDVKRQNDKNGTVKYDGKTEKL
jgi:hypothetical protein